MSDDLDELVIDLPDVEAMRDRSASPRFAVDLRVVWDNGDRCASGPAVNLSISGIFIKTTDPPAVNKDVRLMPMINGQITDVVLHGRVVRVGEAPVQGMGIQFTPKNRQERRLLEKFVETYAQRAQPKPDSPN